MFFFIFSCFSLFARAISTGPASMARCPVQGMVDGCCRWRRSSNRKAAHGATGRPTTGLCNNLLLSVQLLAGRGLWGWHMKNPILKYWFLLATFFLLQKKFINYPRFAQFVSEAQVTSASSYKLTTVMVIAKCFFFLSFLLSQCFTFFTS